jgi:hypothetical protein
MAYGEKQKQHIGSASPKFDAWYDSDCKGPDGDTIDRGEAIVMIEREAWHVQCAERAGYRVPNE